MSDEDFYESLSDATDCIERQSGQMLAEIQKLTMGVGQWEYKIVPCSERDIPELEAQLCELGADRWEVSSAATRPGFLLMYRHALASEGDLAAMLGGGLA